MTIRTRLHGDMVVASNFARAMNDPRYTSAGGEIRSWLDEGRRAFAFELRDVREAGAPFLGLLMTLTRTIRAAGGEVALIGPSRILKEALSEMRLDEFWDVFDSVDEAGAFLTPERPN